MTDQRTIDLRARYGASEQGNFYVCDTIGVPHPYCITGKHVAHAADHFGGMLGKEAIEDAERDDATCGVRGCTLTFAEHETALLVACRVEIKGDDGKAHPELHAYLLAVKERCEADRYAGFAFVREGDRR